MIVPMQRVTVLCLSSDREKALVALRDLGVLHLTHVLPPEGREVEQARHRFEEIHHALEHLPTGGGTPCGEPPETVVETIRKLTRSCKQLNEEHGLLLTELDRIEPFGDFDPNLAERLADDDLHVNLYVQSVRDELRRFRKMRSGWTCPGISARGTLRW